MKTSIEAKGELSQDEIKEILISYLVSNYGYVIEDLYFDIEVKESFEQPFGSPIKEKIFNGAIFKFKVEQKKGER